MDAEAALSMGTPSATSTDTTTLADIGDPAQDATPHTPGAPNGDSNALPTSCMD